MEQRRKDDNLNGVTETGLALDLDAVVCCARRKSATHLRQEMQMERITVHKATLIAERSNVA
jgi:hypothetical protein